MTVVANKGLTINAVRYDWERGNIDWESAMRRLLIFMPENEADSLMRTWAAAIGREVGS